MSDTAMRMIKANVVHSSIVVRFAEAKNKILS
jgi:hypothetical protein